MARCRACPTKLFQLPTMKKFLKRILLIITLALALCIGAVALIAVFFQERIAQALTRSINSQLNAELTIGNFEMGIFRSFPDLSANFEEVALQPDQGPELLRAREAAFRIDLMSLLGPSIRVEAITISDGSLNLLTDQRGRSNYDILKAEGEGSPQGGAGEGNSLLIALQQARFENIELRYTNRQRLQAVRAKIEEGALSGAFSTRQFELASKAKLFCQIVEQDEVAYLPDTEIAYEAIIAVNLEEGTYEMKKVEVDIAGNTFRLDGAVEEWETGTYYDLYATSEDGSLAGVLALLPAPYARKMAGIESTGRFAFNSIIKGQSNASQSPEIRVEFSLDEGQLSHEQLARPLRDVSFQAKFTNGKYRDNSSSVFTLEGFKGYFNRELIEMEASVSNFDAPEIDFNLNGVLPLETAYSLLGNPKITGGDGEVEIKNISIKGKLADMMAPSRMGRVEASGTLEFDDAALTVGEETLLLDRGELAIAGNKLFINGLRLEGAGSDIAFEGSVFNALPVLLADSLNSKGAQLEFEAKLTARSLDIDRLFAFSALTPEEEAEPEPLRDSLAREQLQGRESLTNLLKGTFDARIETFNYQKIEGEDFMGKLGIANGVMSVEGTANAFAGKLFLNGQTFFENEPRLEARIELQRISVEQLFEQSGNFGQDVLTHRNLSGQLEAKLAVYAFWDSTGHFLMDRLRAIAGIGIANGELKDLDMLEGFSSYVDIRDLRRIRFTDMQNYLEIRDQRLFLPAMFIRSNALNLTVSGEHSFEQDISYFLKVNAGQVLADRFRRHDPNLAPRPAKQRGWFNLYFSILGNLEDYNISSDKRRVLADFELGEVRKKDIRRALEREFGQVQLIEEPDAWRDVNDNGRPGSQDDDYLDFEIGGGQ